MAVNGYQFCDLNNDDLEKIKNLEMELNKDKQKNDVILLAFTEQKD